MPRKNEEMTSPRKVSNTEKVGSKIKSGTFDLFKKKTKHEIDSSHKKLSIKEKNIAEPLSLQLDLLIDEKKNPELYRRTCCWPTLAEINRKKIKQYEEFLWHTTESLNVLFKARQRVHLDEALVERIRLLQKICDTVLNPVFQNYLAETNDLANQAEAFLDYIRTSIDFLSRVNFEETYPSLSKQLNWQDRRLVQPKEFELNQLQKAEMELRILKYNAMEKAELQLNRWCFLSVNSFHESVNVIFPFIVSRMDTEKYNDLLKELFTITTMIHECHELVNGASHQDNEKKLKGYIPLSHQLPPMSNSEHKRKIIEQLAKFCSEAQKNNPSFRNQFMPSCMGNETEFYIAENHPLIALIQDFVADYRKHNSHFFSLQRGLLSPRQLEGIARHLKETLFLENNDMENTCLMFSSL